MQVSTTRALETIEESEDSSDRVLDAPIGVHLKARVAGPQVAHGHAESILTPTRFRERALDEAPSNQRELELAHRSFEAEKQPVIGETRIVGAVPVDDAGTNESAHLEQGRADACPYVGGQACSIERCLLPLLPLLTVLAAVVATDRVEGDGRNESEDGHAAVRLLYEAPASCPGREVVVAAIAAQLGYDPIVDGAPTEVALRITADEAGHRAVLTLSADAARSFTSDSCASVVASAAVAFAIAIDPAASFGAPPKRPLQSDAQPRSRLEDIDDKALDPLPAVSLAVGLYAAPYLDLGVAPGLGAGGLVGATLRVGALSLALEGRAAVPRGVQIGDAAFVDVFVAGGSALLCGSAPTGLALFSLCGEVLALDYVVTGRGLRDARTDHALLSAVGPRGAVHFAPWSWLTVGGFVDVLAVLQGVRVRDDRGQELFTSSPVQVVAGATIGGVW